MSNGKNSLQSQPKHESWLLLFNCQSVGLGNSLNLLSDDIRVHFYDPSGFRTHETEILRRLNTFDRILFAPQLEHILPAAITSPERAWRVPTISFNAYHPDICYLSENEKIVKGPMGDYHSLIAFAAFKIGIGIAEATRLYEGNTYLQLGYYDRWDTAKQYLLNGYREAGFDLAGHFVNWSRSGSFMYSFNHPQLRCLNDLGKSILRRTGRSIFYEDAMPHDNLANGPIFPTYPEIGSQLGITGSYMFKPGGEYGFMHLDEFLSTSYELYQARPDVVIHPAHSKLFDRASATIRAL